MSGETNFLNENTTLNGSDRQITHRGVRNDGDEKPIVYFTGRRNLISLFFYNWMSSPTYMHLD